MKGNENKQMDTESEVEQSQQKVAVSEFEQKFLVFYAFSLLALAFYTVGKLYQKMGSALEATARNREFTWAFNVNLADTPIQFVFITVMFVMTHAVALRLARAGYASGTLALSGVMIAFATTILVSILITPYFLFGLLITFITFSILRNIPTEEEMAHSVKHRNDELYLKKVED